eukprot:841365-Prymnesium_polylepis.1
MQRHLHDPRQLGLARQPQRHKVAVSSRDLQRLGCRGGRGHVGHRHGGHPLVDALLVHLLHRGRALHRAIVCRLVLHLLGPA